MGATTTMQATAPPRSQADAGGHPAVADAAREERLARLLRAWWMDERPAWTEQDWWDAPVRPEVGRLLWLPAGPLLAEAVAAVPRGASCPDPHLADSPPGGRSPGHAPGWPCACQVVLAAAWEACAAWCAAGASLALVDAMGPEPVTFDAPMSGQVIDPAREELALALRVTPNSMGNRIGAARALVAHPALVTLVASGSISAWAARLVVLELGDLTPEQGSEVVADVCGRVSRRLASGRRAWNSAEVARAARMARRRACPDSDQEARERAFSRRRVQVFPDRNGMASLVADLDEVAAHRIHRRLSAIVNGLADPTDARTKQQMRADVLVDLLLGATDGMGARPHTADPRRGGGSGVGAESGRIADAGALAPGGADRPPVADLGAARGTPRPEVQVIVSLETLLGLTDDPAVIPGVGPVPADVARGLAADGRWHAWVTDASGALVATGSRGYVPGAALARLVRAREPYCRMPGCRQAAIRCDLDHTIPYPRGATTAANLGPICRRHHVLKTHMGWELRPEQHPDLPVGSQMDGGPEARYPSAAGSRSGAAGGEPSAAGGPGAGTDPPPAWRWRTPAGFTIVDHPEHPLG